MIAACSIWTLWFNNKTKQFEQRSTPIWSDQVEVRLVFIGIGHFIGLLVRLSRCVVLLSNSYAISVHVKTIEIETEAKNQRWVQSS